MARLHAAKKRDPKTLKAKDMCAAVLKLLRDTTSTAFQEMSLYIGDISEEIGDTSLLNWLTVVVEEATEDPQPYFPTDSTGEPIPWEGFEGDLHDANGNVTRTVVATPPTPVPPVDLSVEAPPAE